MTMSFVIKTTESVYKNHHIWIYSFDETMTDIAALVTTCEPGSDSVHIHMNCEGGSSEVGYQLLFSIEEAITAGVHFVLYVESENCSMSSLFICRLILLGAELHIGRLPVLMFHNISMSREMTSLQDLANDVIATGLRYKTALTNCCFPLLTTEEIESILSGKEFWLYPDELLKRVQALEVSTETLH